MRRKASRPAAWIYRRLLKLPEQLRQAVIETERRNLVDILDTCKRWSAGEISREAIAAAGYFYSHNHPTGPPQDPAIINYQNAGRGGPLYGGWRTEGPSMHGSILRSTVRNVVPYSRFMNREGTSKMIPRPIMDRVREEVAPRIRERRAQIPRKVINNG